MIYKSDFFLNMFDLSFMASLELFRAVPRLHINRPPNSYSKPARRAEVKQMAWPCRAGAFQKRWEFVQ